MNSMPSSEDAYIKIPFHRWRDGRLSDESDALVIEEPIEYRIRGEPLATVMRTPGDDRDLAIGFLFCEDWICGSADIGALHVCENRAERSRSSTLESPIEGSNVVDLIPSASARIRPIDHVRLQPVTASCGVCGKRTIDEILQSIPPLTPSDSDISPANKIAASTVIQLGVQLRDRQTLFTRTGALHAAGIFDMEGNVLDVKEDIGRHNAVDKTIGHFVRQGLVCRQRQSDRPPDRLLDRHVLMVSGRVSFEIVQKALRAGIALIVAVSGVSSLGVELSERAGVTVCGFSRDRSFNIYSHPDRISNR